MDHRKPFLVDEEALRSAVCKFYTALYAKYHLELATGKANINQSALALQKALDELAAERRLPLLG